jgi:hypothetical protein
MKLTAEIKRMLDALAYANAGDYLSPLQKDEVLEHSTVARATPAPASAAPAGAKPQVGLYLGSEVSDDAMQYVAHTCARLRHDLTVLTFESESDARALLAPYEPLLEQAGAEMRVVVMTGDPPAALAQALRRRPEVAFLVCNEAGYLGHSLMAGTARKDAIPVPVVLVAPHDEADNAAAKTPTEARRAAGT